MGLSNALINSSTLFFSPPNTTLLMADLSAIHINDDLGSLFQNFVSLTQVILLVETHTHAVSFANVFSGCTALTEITNLDKFTNISNLQQTFYECTSLTGVTFSSVINTNSMTLYGAFEGCTALTEVVNFEKWTLMSLRETFRNCTSLTHITLSPITNTTTGRFTLQDAFNDCTALETINNLELYPGDISNAFNGCRQLTSIRLAALTNATPGTLDGANPNMLKYLPAGSAIPAAWAVYTNFINGNQAEDNPTAYGDIILVDHLADGSYPAYNCPLAFTLPAGSKVTYTRDFGGVSFHSANNNGRQSIILPFEATIQGLTAGTDYQIRPYASSTAEGVLTLAEATDRLAANVPYILTFTSPANTVTFTSASGVTSVPATPATLSALDANNHFTYQGTFLGVSGEAYYLENAVPDAFAKKSLAGGVANTESQPFRAYFTANASTAVTRLTFAADVVGPQVIVTGGTYNGQTLPFATATNTNVIYDLTGATQIEVIGTWTPNQLGGLRNALRNVASTPSTSLTPMWRINFAGKDNNYDLFLDWL